MCKYIFWITAPVTFTFFAVFMILESVSAAGQFLCEEWEDFCFGYTKAGYRRSDRGVWVKDKF